MSTSVDNGIVENLQELGLSLYEARLYLGLLTGGPQNGNELSRTSGVPSSKVYAMLERLAGDGVVTRSQRGSTVQYVCVPPHELLHKLRERYTKPLEYLEATLPTVGSKDPEPDILQIQGIDAIVDHARAIIRASRHEIYLSVWYENVEPLLDDLDAADARGVRIAGMLYGTRAPDVGWWQLHSYRETVASRIGGRMLTMVADGGEALIAHMPDRGDASAVRTRSPVLTLVAEEYLIHDLTLQKAKTMTGYDEWDKWLRLDDEVRMLTLGRTGHLSPIQPDAEAPV
jgi:HTH-type transcriptional regulator, sugar sensing transcriptional regulator